MNQCKNLSQSKSDTCKKEMIYDLRRIIKQLVNMQITEAS